MKNQYNFNIFFENNKKKYCNTKSYKIFIDNFFSHNFKFIFNFFIFPCTIFITTIYSLNNI